MTRWYPSSPKAEAFLLFGVWLQTFLPASSKSNNKPSVPWERRGGWARWERGIRHTAHTRGQPVGRENALRKRTKSLQLKGVFSLATRVLTLWERWRVKKKSKRRRGKKNIYVYAMSFIRFGGWGNVFKRFRPSSKKTFFRQYQKASTNCEVQAEVLPWFTVELHSQYKGTFLFFVSNYTTGYMYFSDFLLANWNSENSDTTIVCFFSNCNLIATITGAYQFWLSVNYFLCEPDSFWYHIYIRKTETFDLHEFIVELSSLLFRSLLINLFSTVLIKNPAVCLYNVLERGEILIKTLASLNVHRYWITCEHILQCPLSPLI